MRRLLTYENRLLVLMSFTFGFVLFDRMALNFLAPFFAGELELNNTEVGLLASLLALTWAISGYVIGSLADKRGNQKTFLLVSVVVFSLCSFLSGLAASFAFLLMTRAIMGLAEGPVLPLAQSLMVGASSEKRRGVNMGFLQTFGSNLLGTVLAPVLLVAIATQFGWRNAFYIAAVPGLLLALAGWFVIKEPPAATGTDGSRTEKASVMGLLRYRNVWVTILLSCCMMTWMFAQITFLPKYLVETKRFSPEQMGLTIAVFGLSCMWAGTLIPWLSDRFGRKPILVIFFIVSMLMPLGIVYVDAGFGPLAGCIFFTATAMGCYSLVLATIPSETVPRQYLAQTLGLVMGIGELMGGFVVPALAGFAADTYTLSAPFFIAAGAAGIAGLVSLLLIETAPAIVKRNRIPAVFASNSLPQ